MKIKRSSWHYKFNHWGGYEKRNDNLCAYFWRLVVKLIIALIGGGLISTYVGLLGYMFFTTAVIANTIMLSFIIAIFAVPIVVIRLLRKKLGKSPKMPYGNILTEYIKAKKSKVCPLIEYI